MPKKEAIWDIDREFFLENCTAISGELNGIPMLVRIGSEKNEAETRIKKIRVKGEKEWKDNGTGYSPSLAWMHEAQLILYQAWKDTNPLVGKEIPDNSFESFVKIIQAVNAGTMPAEYGQINGYVNDLTQSEYKPTRTLLSPFNPNGKNPITAVEIVAVNTGKVKNIIRANPEVGAGKSFNYDPASGTLTLYIGILTSYDKRRATPDLFLQYLATMPRLLVSGSLSRNTPPKIFIDPVSNGKSQESIEFIYR
jgi:hypothetical protein